MGISSGKQEVKRGEERGEERREKREERDKKDQEIDNKSLLNLLSSSGLTKKVGKAYIRSLNTIQNNSNMTDNEHTHLMFFKSA